MHGLIHGLKDDDLYRNKYGYWGWKQYERSFGFLSVGKIKSRQAVINYVCKYICKTLAKDIETANAHMYYRSRGLQEPTGLYSGPGQYNGKWDFYNPDMGLKLAYTNDLNGFEPWEEWDGERMRPAMIRADVPEVDLFSDSIGDILDGYAPLTMLGWDVP
jgi:hypothetical protein